MAVGIDRILIRPLHLIVCSIVFGVVEDPNGDGFLCLGLQSVFRLGSRPAIQGEILGGKEVQKDFGPSQKKRLKKVWDPCRLWVHLQRVPLSIEENPPTFWHVENGHSHETPHERYNLHWQWKIHLLISQNKRGESLVG